MLINVKKPTMVGISTFMSMINFSLSLAEHEKKFYILWDRSDKARNNTMARDLKLYII